MLALERRSSLHLSEGRVNCPVCGLEDNDVLWTERRQNCDRRRHECACGVRWTSVARYERGSLATPGNSTPAPPVMAPKTPANSTPKGGVYSESAIRSGNPDPNPEVRSNPERAHARSTQGADFERLLRVFCERWQRSNKRPYPVTPADRSQLGKFMQRNGHYIATFAEICDRYLSDRRQFTIDRSGNHRLAWLVTSGLALYGGTPRETAEQYSARVRREHEERKVAARRPPEDTGMRDLIASLADQKVAG